MKYVNFEENRKIGQKVSLKKSDVIGYKKKRTLRAFATRAKKRQRKGFKGSQLYSSYKPDIDH